MRSLRLVAVMCGAMLAVPLLAGAAHAELRKQWVDYQDGGTPLSGYLVYDDAVTAKRPGVLLAHSRAGLAEAALRDSEMIARMGYVVFAEDIFGKGVVPKDVPEMMARIAVYNQDRPLMRSRARAGFEVLRTNTLVDATRIAVIGYCFGGTVAVELAETGVPVVGTVSVHGSFRGFPPDAANNVHGRVLILHGTEDSVAPLSEVNALVDQLRAAKVGFEVRLFSGTEHAFTAPRNAAEERADREYKVAARGFFKEVFGE